MGKVRVRAGQGKRDFWCRVFQLIPSCFQISHKGSVVASNNLPSCVSNLDKLIQFASPRAKLGTLTSGDKFNFHGNNSDM